jgi:type I restriction enzyme R subunit
MTEHTKTILQSNNFIVLDKYTNIDQSGVGYQTEAELEHEFINDLQNQGIEYLPNVNSNDSLMANLKLQIQNLNRVTFSNDEWQRFLNEYLDEPSETLTDKSRKLADNYIYEFTFDDGQAKNIYLLDKKKIVNNSVQAINQYEVSANQKNRYDVTLLINGLPLIQIELKKRGVSIREAFNQVHRYSKESFNSQTSLFKYLQIFVISNGTDTRYFANTTKRNKSSYDFTMNWARADNTTIKDLKDFTATFFQKNTLLNLLIKYSVFDSQNQLLIMRPYQIAATERILWKIISSHNSKIWNKPESGGYIWHTTGSGKTLTSFKAAQLATELDFIDKVFFVVDRKDLDYQTMKEYQRFSPDSVNGSNDTKGLKENILKNDNKIIVTTIQKLNNLMKKEASLDIYSKEVVFIFDEAHRSQFGEAQKNIKKQFKKFFQFGFTGTPIFPENALGSETTASVFGRQLHSYVITDAIRDDKVLKFKVDYNDVRPKFKSLENETDPEKMSASENKRALLHPDRIKQVSTYILDKFKSKTHRNNASGKGFNAMFAVSSVDAAKLYYEQLDELQEYAEYPLKIATIFSYAANEEQNAIGDIDDEDLAPEGSALDMSAKEFLANAIDDYNRQFKTSFGVDSKSFQNYYRDLSQRVKNQEVDLLIVVGMFLTGFDAPTLNTLFVDKILRYHGLIQSFSRTNRIYDSTKPFGNIVTFRNLEENTQEAIKLFGDESTANVVLEKPYKDYLNGHVNEVTGNATRGYLDVVVELQEKYPDPNHIERESEKKDFVKLFGEYLKLDNILSNYDEFDTLKDYQNLDLSDDKAVERFKNKHYLENYDFKKLSEITIPTVRLIQDYRSTYNDIRDSLREANNAGQDETSEIDWSDVVFEVDLLNSQEINLDYILELIFEQNKKVKDKAELIEEVTRTIRSSLGNRAKEGLIIDFINSTDLNEISEKTTIIDKFFQFAKKQKDISINELIKEENLKDEEAKRYINNSLLNGFASENGTELNETLPKMSPLNPKYLHKKESVFKKISQLVEKFKEI